MHLGRSNNSLFVVRDSTNIHGEGKSNGLEVGHNKGISSVSFVTNHINGANIHNRDLLPQHASNSPTQKYNKKPIRYLVPVAALSSLFLFGFDYPSFPIFNPFGFHLFGLEQPSIPRPPLLNPFSGLQEFFNDPFDFKESISKLSAEHKQLMDDVAKYVHEGTGTKNAPEWIQNMMIWLFGTFTISSQSLIYKTFTAIFYVISKVTLFIPDFLFKNEWLGKSILSFLGLSLGSTCLWSAVQGFKRICKLEYTSLTQVLKRLPITLLVSSFAPILVTKLTSFLNYVTNLILETGLHHINSTAISGFSVAQFGFTPVLILLMIAFLVVLFRLSVPLILSNGKRWFDFLMCTVTLPFAMSCYIFNDTQHYFNMWKSKLKQISMTQIFNAFVVSIVGVILFGTPVPTSLMDILCKMLVMVGALYYLAFPPSGLGLDSGEDVVDAFKKVKRKGKKDLESYKKHKPKMDYGLKFGRIMGRKWGRQIMKKWRG